MPLNSQTGFFDFRECLQQSVISTIFSIWLLLKYKRALCYLIEIQDAGFDQHVVWSQRDQGSHQLFRLLYIALMGTFLFNCSYDLHLGHQVFVSNCLSCDQIEIQSKTWGINVQHIDDIFHLENHMVVVPVTFLLFPIFKMYYKEYWLTSVSWGTPSAATSPTLSSLSLPVIIIVAIN